MPLAMTVSSSAMGSQRLSSSKLPSLSPSPTNRLDSARPERTRSLQRSPSQANSARRSYQMTSRGSCLHRPSARCGAESTALSPGRRAPHGVDGAMAEPSSPDPRARPSQHEQDIGVADVMRVLPSSCSLPPLMLVRQTLEVLVLDFEVARVVIKVLVASMMGSAESPASISAPPRLTWTSRR